MNTKIYKSAILNAARLSGNETKSSDNLAEVREIFKTCGVEFPKGTIDEVKGILKTNDYTSWETNTKNDIQSLADNGYPSVAIFNDKVVIIAPKSDEEYADISAAATVDVLPDEPAEYFSHTRTSSVISMLDRLKGQFPGGKYWNHVGMSGNNADGYTYHPCPTHSTLTTCNDYNGSKQCIGFAYKCASIANNGANSFSFTKNENVSTLDSVKPGDIIVYSTSKGAKHAVYVTKVLENGFVFGDCNGETETADGLCRIRWDAYREKSFFESKFLFVRVSPTRLTNF